MYVCLRKQLSFLQDCMFWNKVNKFQHMDIYLNVGFFFENEAQKPQVNP